MKLLMTQSCISFSLVWKTHLLSVTHATKSVKPSECQLNFVFLILWVRARRAGCRPVINVLQETKNWFGVTRFFEVKQKGSKFWGLETKREQVECYHNARTWAIIVKGIEIDHTLFWLWWLFEFTNCIWTFLQHFITFYCYKNENWLYVFKLENDLHTLIFYWHTSMCASDSYTINIICLNCFYIGVS